MKNKPSQTTINHYLFLPSPDELKKYAELDAEIPQKIMEALEKQTSHRIKMEEKSMLLNEQIVSKKHREIMAGQIFTFIILICLLAFSLTCMFMGWKAAGVGTLLAGIASVVGATIYSKYFIST